MFFGSIKKSLQNVENMSKIWKYLKNIQISKKKIEKSTIDLYEFQQRKLAIKSDWTWFLCVLHDMCDADGAHWRSTRRLFEANQDVLLK